LTSETPVHSLLPFKDLREKIKKEREKIHNSKGKGQQKAMAAGLL